MGNFFGGRNSLINRAGRDINRTFIDTTQGVAGWVNKGASGVTEAALKQARQSLRDLNKAGNNINREWRAAGKGEVGKYVTSVGQSAYNAVTAAPRAVITGQYGKEAQKLAGSLVNIQSAGTLDYAGRSSGIQKFLKQDKTFIGSNLAGLSHGTSTLSREGKLNKSDKNQILQGGVKVGAAVGAFYGGSAIYSYLSAPSAATATATTTASAGSGLGVSTAKISADVAGAGIASSGATAAGTTAAASGTSLGTYLGYAAVGGTVANVALGKKSVGEGINAILNPGQPDYGSIADLFKNPRNGPSLSYDPSGNYAGGGYASGGDTVKNDVTPYVYGALALAAIFIVVKKAA